MRLYTTHLHRSTSCFKARPWMSMATLTTRTLCRFSSMACSSDIKRNPHWHLYYHIQGVIKSTLYSFGHSGISHWIRNPVFYPLNIIVLQDVREERWSTFATWTHNDIFFFILWSDLFFLWLPPSPSHDDDDGGSLFLFPPLTTTGPGT